MSALHWWSASKHEWKDLTAMHDVEARNAFRKLQRGEYRLPNGMALDPMGQLEMESAFLAEFQRRGLDENGNPFVEEA